MAKTHHGGGRLRRVQRAGARGRSVTLSPAGGRTGGATQRSKAAVPRGCPLSSSAGWIPPTAKKASQTSCPNGVRRHRTSLM
eukprot:9813433-Alexandrium_andersonii.AAC.1